MDLSTAIEDATRIIGAPMAALLSNDDLAASAARAGNDQDGYDSWLLAAELADLLGIRAQASGHLTEVSSEGTTLKRTTADYFAMAAALRAKSASLAGKNAGIGVVSIGMGGGYDSHPSWALDGYWTWDADVPVWHAWAAGELP